MFHRRRLPVLLPVDAYGSHAVRADRGNFGNLALRQRFEIVLRQLSKCQIVAQPARRVAGALLFAKNAEAYVQLPHYRRERGDDLAALRIIPAHAAQPEAVFLGPVEYWQILYLNDIVSLACNKYQ